MDQKKLLFLYNTHAGQGQAALHLAAIQEALTRSGWLVTARPTLMTLITDEAHPVVEDFALLRRELIDYRLLERNAHTGEYWVNPNPPTHTGSQAQEMAGLEVFLR